MPLNYRCVTFDRKSIAVGKTDDADMHIHVCVCVVNCDFNPRLSLKVFLPAYTLRLLDLQSIYLFIFLAVDRK